MTAIPGNIEKEHIIQAINEIDSNGIPEKRKSKNHFIIHNGKRYPQKYVLSLANKFANGKMLEDFNANQAQNFLKKFDFLIEDPDKELSPEEASAYIDKTLNTSRLPEFIEDSTDIKTKSWGGFCEKHNILQKGVPLFEIKEGSVVIKNNYGRNKRRVLLRSDEMKNLVIEEVGKVTSDFINNNYCGLIYIMYWKKDSQVIPLYIGKCGKSGRIKVLNTNLENISHNEHCFCRWGDDYDRHIGGLSAATLCDYSRKEPKYENWAEVLFESKPTDTPKEIESTWFWIIACDKELLKEYHAKSLGVFESMLIDSARPLLNVRKKL